MGESRSYRVKYVEALTAERDTLKDKIGYAINYLNDTEMEADWRIDTARNCLETAINVAKPEKADGKRLEA